MNGTVWAFEEDGDPLTHHFIPVGIIMRGHTYAIRVTPKVFDFPDILSVGGTNSSEVAELIDAANRFCDETGYTSISGVSKGANVHSTDNANLLVLHCVPPGVEIPLDAKVGDDVQRNPLYRALGVPPLRGRDFIRRYGR